MYEEENLTPAEQALESALGQLKPVTNIMNRDKLMFNAGRASIGKKQPWQILSGVLAVLLVCSVSIRLDSGGTQIAPSDKEQKYIQIAQTQYEPAKDKFTDSLPYPKLREKIIENGMDALQLQQNPRHTEPAMNQRQWLDSMLSS